MYLLNLKDTRSDCHSLIYETTVDNYLSLAERVYEDQQGGLEGQRAPLKTKTGRSIRARMVEDIRLGSILPPLVLGVVVEEDIFDEIGKIQTQEELESLLSRLDSDQLSVIDGMQRTTAILSAKSESDIGDNPVRIEVWVSRNIGNLVYRMLVLNTGQVPWDMRRQLETIYRPLLREIKERAPNIKAIGVDDRERRKGAAEYHADKIVELFLVFTSRKVHIDLKDRVAEDFARMDATEATAHLEFIDYFAKTLDFMARLDEQMSRVPANEDLEGKISSGRDIFKSSPAGVGFFVACATYIYGDPGFNYDEERTHKEFARLEDSLERLIRKLEAMEQDQLSEFLDLATINERLSRRSGKVGEFEREYFFAAFRTLIQHSDQLPSFEPCWVAR
ncbi:hypothetical protein [Marinobacter sp. Arc7-DN-1]|uniref:hypothetical protein n=1 Tax=Marinobacter sp. Arc7-DN-1 TaxID=2304594 RepID=UPI001966D619|nr:hypothetical protein [Marinobacter sp. Arc7-DN-1]